MTDFRRKQILAVALSIPAFVVVGVVMYFAKSWFDFVALPADELPPRVAFVLQWLFPPACTLALGVQFAARRGFYADAIDGTRFPARRSMEINLRYNQNTLEQLCLAAIVWANFSIAIDRDALVLIPAMSALFVVGRITFWIGYLINPIARAFGMVLTALPTLVAIIWLLVHWTR